MKLTQLIAQFLYINKKLELPGIGRFSLDPSVVIDPESEKNNRREITDAIQFEHDPRIRETPELIAFIAERTGKMKALAAADLDSHLWLGQQFLNIGKPFVLEGIGHLLKNQQGQFEFTPGILQPEVLKSQPERAIITENSVQENDGDYSNILQPRKETATWRRPLAFLFILAGIGIAIWAGYYIYRQSQPEETAATQPPAPEKNEAPVPSAPPSVNVQNVQPDTMLTDNQVATSPETTLPRPASATTYKFIVETAGKKRAFERFQRLKNLPTDVKMETADSITFNLFFLLAASPADTTKLLDSLRTCYTPKWSKAFIAQ